MKNLLLTTLIILFCVSLNAQTWLEKAMNGQDYGSANPPSTPEVNLYSEPFDTTWRQGYTGIGTAQWPKTRLQVHSNENIDAELALFMTIFNNTTYTDFSSIFTSGGTNAVGSTTSSLFGLTARHDVDDAINYGIIGVSYGNDIHSNHGVLGGGFAENSFETMGVSGSANGSNNGRLVGVQGKAEGDGQSWGNFGVWGQCNSIDPNGVNVGVFGRGINDDDGEQAMVNIGVHGRANCGTVESGTQFNCGIYGQNVGCTDSTYGGAGYPTGSFAGYFDGNVLTTGWSAVLSDRRLKENIKPLSSATERLRKVNVYSYNFKQGMGLSLSNSLSYGVLADELEKEFPEMVKYVNVINHSDPKNYRNIESYKSVDYDEFIPLLIQSVKELSDKIDNLDPEKSTATLAGLKEKIESLEKNLNYSAVSRNAELSSSMTAYPNPSNSDMIIDIRGSSCNNCWLLISDLSGRLVKQYNLFNQQDKITLSASEFGSGLFQCSLVEEGNVTSSIKIAFVN